MTATRVQELLHSGLALKAAIAIAASEDAQDAAIEGIEPSEPVAASIFYSETDPGAVGAGAIWIKPVGDTEQELYIRSEDDTEWLAASLSKEDATIGRARMRLVTSGTSAYVELVAEDAEGIERARARFESISSGGGFAVPIKSSADLQVATLNLHEVSGQMVITPDTGSIGLYFDLTSLYLNTPASGVTIYNNPAESEVSIIPGSVDPSAGAGVAAGIGSLYLRTNGELWIKTSAPDTGWTQMATV